MELFPKNVSKHSENNVSKHSEIQKNGAQNFLKSGNFLKIILMPANIFLTTFDNHLATFMLVFHAKYLS